MMKSFTTALDRGKHVQAWRTSLLSQSAYCKAHGLNLSTFNSWLRGAGAQPIQACTVRTLRLPTATAKVANERALTAIPLVFDAFDDGRSKHNFTSRGESTLKLSTKGGMLLTLPTGTDVHWLAALLRAC